MRRRLLPRIAGAVAVCAALAGAAVVPAQADDLATGGWYFDRGNVQKVQDEGFTGKGATVAVIDSPINPDVPTLRGVAMDVSPLTPCHAPDGAPIAPESTDIALAGHGTNVASMIVGTGAADPGQLPIRGVAPGAHLLYYAIDAGIDASGHTVCADAQGAAQKTAPEAAAIDAAVQAHADIISVSSGTVISGDLQAALARAIAQDVIVVGALANDPSDVTTGDWPGAANGVVGVQAFDAQGRIQSRVTGSGKTVPNYSDFVKVAAPGVGILVQGGQGSWDQQRLADGTSYATPIVAAFLAVLKGKYPTATGNQLLQTMIRTTGKTHHEPRWTNDFGYGAISLTTMLEDDPTTYPDVNPFFDATDLNKLPSADDVRAAGGTVAGPTMTPTPTSTATAAAAGAPPASSSALPWVLGGGIGLVLITGIAVWTLVTIRRRRSAPASVAAADEDERLPAETPGQADQRGNR